MMHRLIDQPEKFFARKFDPRIDIHPINAVEAIVNGTVLFPLAANTP
jgi:hypothetical protein